MSPKVKDILEWVYCIVIAIVLALLFRYYIGTPTIVKQVSMNPTLVQNQRLWLNRWGRTTKKIAWKREYNNIEAPSKKVIYIKWNWPIKSSCKIWIWTKKYLGKFTYYVLEIGKDSYIKRVIALPGEHVQIKDGKVFINGEQLQEDYLPSGIVTDVTGAGFDDFVVPENCVFAMGDNRNHSTDCRAFGCIPLEKIESKVWIRIWPLNLWGKVK